MIERIDSPYDYKFKNLIHVCLRPNVLALYTPTLFLKNEIKTLYDKFSIYIYTHTLKLHGFVSY